MLDQPSLPLAGQILLGILVAAAAVFDIRFRRIPNWLVLAGIVAGLVWNGFSSGWSGLGRGAEGLGLGFILYFPFYMIRALGAGDVKLLAAVGAITGPGNCFWIFLATAILGGAIAVLIMFLHGRLNKTLFNVAWIVRDLLHFQAPYKSSEELDVTSSKGLRLPHAAMMAIGTVAFILMVEKGFKV